MIQLDESGLAWASGHKVLLSRIVTSCTARTSSGALAPYKALPDFTRGQTAARSKSRTAPDLHPSLPSSSSSTSSSALLSHCGTALTKEWRQTGNNEIRGNCRVTTSGWIVSQNNRGRVKSIKSTRIGYKPRFSAALLGQDEMTFLTEVKKPHIVPIVDEEMWMGRNLYWNSANVWMETRC